MDTIVDADTNESASVSIRLPPVNKAASIPITQKPSFPLLVEKQISAPSYLHSLKENELPPFKRPGKEPKPRILIGHIFNKDEVIAMVGAANSAANDLKELLGTMLIEKNIVRNFDVVEKKYLISLIIETIDYAAQHDFDEFKLALLLTIYVDTHLYFKWYYWHSPSNVWSYFKETMIRHTIEDSPTGQQVFEPEECYDILTHFHTIYLTNLPLIHVLCFGAYQIKYTWPFKPPK